MKMVAAYLDEDPGALFGLRQGSSDGVKEGLHLNWLMQEIAGPSR